MPSRTQPYTGRRIPILDGARGIAIAMMLAYHLCFDLNFLGWTHFDFYHDHFWVSARSVIVSLFLLIMGISLHLGHRERVRWNLRRLAILLCCATSVSLASYLVFPKSAIYFGVLHFILVASLLCPPLVPRPKLALGLAIIILGLGVTVHSDFFDPKPLSWIGFVAHKPVTEDFVPLFPWLAPVMFGIFLGDWLTRHQLWPAGNFPESGAGKFLTFAGRHSLAIYMLHQPILLAILIGLQRLLT